MMNRWSFEHLPKLRQWLTWISYEYISKFDKDVKVLFLNYGYVDLDPGAERLELPAEDEEQRYQIQLYHHVASAIDWTGLEALEVSSGRGGGADYISRRFMPHSYTGVDLSTEAVRFCSRHFSAEGLSFEQGDAESLHFSDNAFDVVLNLEASLYYPNVERFLSHVVRILKPGGHFLYADMRYTEEIDGWRTQMKNTGLELLKAEDITPNVVKALALDQDRKRNLVERYTPRILHKAFAHFGGISGDGLARGEPKVGERNYLFFVFRKKDNVL
jgi:ubiquinone/menaquinone biosynthesis C-methylase UbiE